jgi:ATP/maltotriose-dependent transcriptional regulator MalT
MGLGRLADAERTLAELAELDTGKNRGLSSERRILAAKLAVAAGKPSDPLEETTGSDSGEPAWAAGEYRGLVALAAAGAGDAERARLEADATQALTGWVEGRFYAGFARVIADLLEKRPGADEAARELALDAASAGMLDAVVLASRAHPALSGVLEADERTRALLRGAEPDGRGDLAHLTAREREVLELMCEGLGNAEISRRLFISEKTTKVHVSHIFEKLGVRTRVQAVLAAQRMSAPEDTSG